MKFEFILTLTDISRRVMVLYIASTVLVHSQMHRFLLLIYEHAEYVRYSYNRVLKFISHESTEIDGCIQICIN